MPAINKTVNKVTTLIQLNIVHLYNIHQLLSLEITCTTIINKVSIG